MRARRSVIVAGALAAVLAVGVLLHTGPGLRLLVALGVACPALAVSPGAAAALRAEGLAALRGSTRAPIRYARDLTLGASRETDARAQAARDNAGCVRKRRGFTLLLCTRATGAGGSEETTFAFDASDRLLSVDVVTRFARPADGDAAQTFNARAATLAGQLGRAQLRAGDMRAVLKSGAPYATALVRYRFSDYLATVTAVRLSSGLVVREQYQSVPAAPPA